MTQRRLRGARRALYSDVRLASSCRSRERVALVSPEVADFHLGDALDALFETVADTEILRGHVPP